VCCRASTGSPRSWTRAPIEATNERPIIAVAIQPALRPGSRFHSRLMISVPASGKARTSQPYAVALI
jgi:hypothetical protein